MRLYVYISTARADLSNSEVEEILAASQRKNPERGITGFLIYNGRNFLQLVEGEKEALETLMDELGQDERHHGIVRIEDVGIDARTCGDWAMRRLSLAQNIEERRKLLAGWIPDAIDDQVRRTVMNFASLN